MKTLKIAAIICVALLAGCASGPKDSMFVAPARPIALRGDGDTYLPESFAGWRRDGAAREFALENINQLVRDDASMYSSYGVRRAWSARYNSPDGRGTVEARLFVMRSLLDSFGVFSRLRGEGSTEMSLGVEGFREGDVIAFYHSHYFMQLIQDDRTSPHLLNELAGNFSTHIVAGRERVKPKELILLSEKGMRKGSESYIASNVLGLDYLPKGLSAEYEVNGAPVTSHLVVFNNAQEAERAFIRSRNEWHRDGMHLEMHEVFAFWGASEEVIAIGHPATDWTAFSHIDRFLIISRGPHTEAISQTSHQWLYLVYTVKE